jgi:hypothetical protein
MTHIADFSVKRFLLPVVPVLLGYHNAIIEDMLARADHLATGTQLRYPRVPRWLRAVNALETGWWRWRGKLPPAEGRPGKRRRPVANVVAGALVPTLLLGLGTLHAAWGLGSSWPAADRDSLAHWVIGPGAVMPPDAACWTVAALLTLAAAGTSAAARGARSRHVPPIAWATAAALLARGLVYPPIDLASGLSSDRDRIDLAVYSPLCVLLGLGALFLARDLPSRRSARAAATA